MLVIAEWQDGEVARWQGCNQIVVYINKLLLLAIV